MTVSERTPREMEIAAQITALRDEEEAISRPRQIAAQAALVGRYFKHVCSELWGGMGPGPSRILMGGRHPVDFSTNRPFQARTRFVRVVALAEETDYPRLELCGFDVYAPPDPGLFVWGVATSSDNFRGESEITADEYEAGWRAALAVFAESTR